MTPASASMASRGRAPVFRANAAQASSRTCRPASASIAGKCQRTGNRPSVHGGMVAASCAQYAAVNMAVMGVLPA
jgi:hypothetical protein